MNCASCKEELPADVAFCPNCGAAVAKSAAADNPSRAAAPASREMDIFSGLETVVHGRSGLAATTPTLEPGKIFAGRYAIGRKIGEGGMGVVYAAKDNNTNEEIVLKLIHPDLVSGEEAMKRLVAEGVTARQIRHPNIVAVYDVGQFEGQPFLAMEYIPGGTLRTWIVNAIASGQETGLTTAVGVVRSILAGLAEAHRMGVVHRDLKPENILLGGDPARGDFSLKILDFGIARTFGSGATNRSGSTGGVGTPLYMAPEQRTAPDTVGPSADLYSVSAIFYELLMEAAPQGRWELPSEHRSDVPKALDKVIERGLAMRARSRFQSVADYLAALDDALGASSAPQEKPAEKYAAALEQRKLDGTEPATRGKPEPPPPATTGTNRKLIWGAAIAAILVLGVIGNMIDKDQPGSSAPAPASTPQQPAPQRPLPVASASAAINAAGVWYDDGGVPFQAVQNGDRIGATGIVQGTPVRLEGTLGGDGMKFQVANAATGQLLFRGDGYVLNPSHLSYSLYALNGGLINRGCFHINHMPNPPCVNGRL